MYERAVVERCISTCVVYFLVKGGVAVLVWFSRRKIKMSYEAEQSRLQRLLQEVLSDESDSDCNSLFGDANLSDDYEESDDAASDTDSTDSKGSFAPPRKIRHIRKSKPAAVHGYIDVPSTSSYSVNDANVNSVLSTSGQPMPTSAADTIEDVIQKFVMDSSNSDKNGSDEEIAQQNTTNEHTF